MHEVYAKSILTSQMGLNPYRGCTHGCIYCDSRSRCYRFDHDFEDIAVKVNAPELLDAALRKKRERCVIGTGAMCDPYMPVEEGARLTRACLEVIRRRGFGAAVQTKSPLLLRDMDLMRAINRGARFVAEMTLTTADDELCRKVEPHVAVTSERARALKELAKNGIDTAVWISPLLPFINDTSDNIEQLARICADAGVKAIVYFSAGVTLREGSREYFYDRLDAFFPGMRRRYAEKYALRYEVASDRDAELSALLHKRCAEYGMLCGVGNVFDWMRRMPQEQTCMRLGDI